MTFPPLLSLCVPTFNRAALLDQSLRAILSQVAPSMADRVEVLVLDNASPDDTPAVVAQAEADFPHIPLRSIRRPQNIGPDANFCQAIQEARGEFVYLLSDDDVLLPGAVERLLSLMETYPGFDAFCLNVQQFWESPYEEPRSDPALKPDRFLGEEQRLISTRDEALLFLQTHITFMSSIVFRRANVAHKDYTDKFATTLVQAYLFLDALVPGRGLYALRRPFLAQRADNNQGFDFFQVFVTNFHDLMCYARQRGYSQDAVDRVLAAHLEFIYHFVLIFKYRGNWGTLRPNFREGLWRLRQVYGWNKFVLLRLLPAMLLPRPVLYQMQRLYAHVRFRPFEAPCFPPPAPSGHNG